MKNKEEKQTIISTYDDDFIVITEKTAGTRKTSCRKYYNVFSWCRLIRRRARGSLFTRTTPMSHIVNAQSVCRFSRPRRHDVSYDLCIYKNRTKLRFTHTSESVVIIVPSVTWSPVNLRIYPLTLRPAQLLSRHKKHKTIYKPNECVSITE